MVVRYDRQVQGAELINVNNELYDERRWTRIRRETLDDGDWRLETVQALGGAKRHIAYWYVIGGKATSSRLVAKVLELYGALTGQRTAYQFAVSVRQRSLDGVVERAALDTFVRALRPMTTTRD